jgi:hypothetical protein
MKYFNSLLFIIYFLSSIGTCLAGCDANKYEHGFQCYDCPTGKVSPANSVYESSCKFALGDSCSSDSDCLAYHACQQGGTGGSSCTHTNNGAVDTYLDDCDGYDVNSAIFCGTMDTVDFKSKTMCCGCQTCQKKDGMDCTETSDCVSRSCKGGKCCDPAYKTGCTACVFNQNDDPAPDVYGKCKTGFCEANYYEVAFKCEECPTGKISYAGSIGLSKCVKATGDSCTADSDCISGNCGSNKCQPNTKTCAGATLQSIPEGSRRRLSTNDALLLNSMLKWKELASKSLNNKHDALGDALKLSLDHLLGNITKFEQHPNNRLNRRLKRNELKQAEINNKNYKIPNVNVKRERQRYKRILNSKKGTVKHQFHIGGVHENQHPSVAKKVGGRRKLNQQTTYSKCTRNKPDSFLYLDDCVGVDGTADANSGVSCITAPSTDDMPIANGVHKVTEVPWCMVQGKTPYGFWGYSRAKYALVDYECKKDSTEQYPGFSDDSKCEMVTPDDSGEGLPYLKCKMVLIFSPKVYITFILEIKFAFGLDGTKEKMDAIISFGIATSRLPRSCWGPEKPGASMNANQIGVDPLCNILTFAAQNLDSIVPITTVFGGSKMKLPIKLFPLQFHYPESFTGGDNDKLATLLRMQVFPEKDFCISNVATIMNIRGNIGRILKAIGALLQLSGTDLCIKLPGSKFTSSGAFETGLEISGYVFDQSKVTMDGFWNAFPSKFSGIVAKVKEQFEYQPTCPGLASDKCKSLSDKMVDLITSDMPSKLEFKYDIVKIIYDLLNSQGESLSILKQGTNGGNYYFSFPNMVVFRDNVVRPPLVVNHAIPLTVETASSTNMAVISGSNCDIKLSTMPKVIDCYLKQNVDDKLSFEFKFRFSLGFNLDGAKIAIIPEIGFKIAYIGKTISSDLANKINLFEQQFDVGAFIDEDLEDTIKMNPPSIQIPAKYSDGELMEVGRLNIGLGRRRLSNAEKSFCLNNLKSQSFYESIPDEVADKLELLQLVGGLIGGNLCVEFPILQISKGVRIQSKFTFSAFKKSDVDVEPLFNLIKSLVPNGPQKVVLAAALNVAGDQFYETINNMIKSGMPSSQKSFTVNIGKKLRSVLLGQGRRLTAANLIDKDGVFRLGSIYASDNPFSQAFLDTGFDSSEESEETEETTAIDSLNTTTDQLDTGNVMKYIPSLFTLFIVSILSML